MYILNKFWIQIKRFSKKYYKYNEDVNNSMIEVWKRVNIT